MGTWALTCATLQAAEAGRWWEPTQYNPATLAGQVGCPWRWTDTSLSGAPPLRVEEER
jgi:hypothetical protein